LEANGKDALEARSLFLLGLSSIIRDAIECPISMALHCLKVRWIEQHGMAFE